MKILKTIAKLLISVLALYFVFKKIDLTLLWETIIGANFIFLFVAALLFVSSQFVSSIRLLYFFKDISIHLGKLYNWKLYLLGMYYNLLFPGGIGGDGYKVYLLEKMHQKGKVKIIKALLFDRLSGLLGLLVWLCVILALYSSIVSGNLGHIVVLLIVILLLIVVSYVLVRYIFATHLASFMPSLVLSLLIQGLQLGVCLAILASFGVNQNILAYLALFLISSIAAVVPITIGGAGARELTFLAGADYFPIEINIAIGLSVIFYIITVLASFIGLYYSFKKELE